MSENSTDERLTHLRNAILRAFPDVVFDGPITHHDGEWPDEVTEETAIYEGQVAYGDEMILYQGLKGHKWSEIPREFLEGMVMGLCTAYKRSAGRIHCGVDDAFAGEFRRGK